MVCKQLQCDKFLWLRFKIICGVSNPARLKSFIADLIMIYVFKSSENTFKFILSLF